MLRQAVSWIIAEKSIRVPSLVSEHHPFGMRMERILSQGLRRVRLPGLRWGIVSPVAYADFRSYVNYTTLATGRSGPDRAAGSASVRARILNGLGQSEQTLDGAGGQTARLSQFESPNAGAIARFQYDLGCFGTRGDELRRELQFLLVPSSLGLINLSAAFWGRDHHSKGLEWGARTQTIRG